ncbi:MAG: 30S ribosomal protein S17 [Candidatus Bathyarchaeia archaeon]
MRNIGIPVSPPKRSCEDSNCPFHGTLPVRGRVIEGVVISDRMKGTVTVRRDYHYYVPKYMRYERRHSHISAHNPPCIDAGEGDKVKIAECRPLSKSVAFVVVEKSEE